MSKKLPLQPQPDVYLVHRLLFRLLPVQILLAAVSQINGIVSSLFASNYIGAQAMSAVGLYAPIGLLIGAVSVLFVSGSQIICGKFLGNNQVEQNSRLFSVSMLGTGVFSAVTMLLLVAYTMPGFPGRVSGDPETRRLLNRYILGQVPGVLPLLWGQQLSAFLSLENRAWRSTVASLASVAVTVGMNFLLVVRYRLGTLGLALASSAGLWVFLLVEAAHFLSGRSIFRLHVRLRDWSMLRELVRVGMPNSLTTGYVALRGVLINALILRYVGELGISAFSTANSFLGLFWAIPNGMLAVSRMVFGVSIREEDRKTLADVMRNALYRFVPLMAGISALLILLARPLTFLYYQDASAPVFEMTEWGFRILPLCMPLSVISMHFACYGQASNKRFLVGLLALLDGIVFVVLFSALLLPKIGLNGVYAANVLNGIGCAAAIFIYSWIIRRKLPSNMEELMVIPDTFGAAEEDRLDLSVRKLEEVVQVSRKVQGFSLEKGIDPRRAAFAALAMEEMAGNIIEHGFPKDRRRHSVDLRIVFKNGDIMIRFKDDCRPFDPRERQLMMTPEDPAKNIGLRIVFRIAKEHSYQNLLGLNVLTVKL
ncbi:MAG: ATP-binding protein [Oscillospiraceae bacterium]|nr:ATP-binding protein [Oscillospiraceae bacterium]